MPVRWALAGEVKLGVREKKERPKTNRERSREEKKREKVGDKEVESDIDQEMRV